MMSTMENIFGLSGNTLSWLSTYLAPWSFKVSIEGNVSADKPVTFLVPQGSVAGPILFNYYVRSLPNCIKHDGVTINGLADDHALHNSYRAGDISAEINSIRILEDSLCSVNDWMGQNKLQMNPSKTKFISFGSKTMIKKLQEPILQCAMIQFLAHRVLNFWGHTWINHSPCLHTSPRNVAWQCGIYHGLDPLKIA